ncbi:hypothetical protein [Halorussus amylolyticus]|uniref:hypothetical protein n=1 Tax=Halorussus amylolyticus TaxID=1126242 RepID=UPI00104642A6|nr:hypothetical protein [Halorussus amylolyticus]
MNPTAKSPSRSVAFSLLTSTGIAVIPILAYVAIWRWTVPDFYLFLILGTYLLLGVLGVCQALRAIRMDSWIRRLGALSVTVGFAATIFFGLRPRAGCLEAGACLSGLTLHPLQFAFGLILTSLSLFLDVRDRPKPLRSR